MSTGPFFSRLLHMTDGFPRSATRWGWRFSLAMLTGVFAGLAAVVLEQAIEFGSHHLVFQFAAPGSNRTLNFNWAILLLPAIGGLIAGLVVHLTCAKSPVQGVELMTHAFHHGMGQMKLRSPTIKAMGAALVISCGGSTGPEGPIAAWTAAIGSTIGRWFPITPQERRILLIAGCAAGVGAIFRCPLGGALFAAGILYQEPEFEADAIVPSVIASVVGYTLYVGLLGFEGPMLRGVDQLRFTSPVELPPYIVLGLLCGAVSIFFSLTYRLVERRLVPRSPLPKWANPAVGGLITGGLACLLPQVMDGRYEFIQNALDGSFVRNGTPDWWALAALFGALVLIKCIATAFTVGSGAPGGLLGPAVFIGGAVGAFLGAVCEALFPNTFPEPMREALIPVGMAGVLAATMRVPLASLVMVTEMTGSYGLIAPLMLVCVVSYVIGRRWGLNDEQVRSASDSPAHAADPIVHVLESLPVRRIMQRAWPLTVDPDTPLDELLERIDPGTRPVVAVARDGELLGLITPADVGRVLDEPAVASILVASDAMGRRIDSIKPDDDLYYALSVFQRTGHEVLPVLGEGDGRNWEGMLSVRHVASSVRREMSHLQTDVLREHEALHAIGQEWQMLQMLQPIAPEHADRVHRLFVPIQAIGKTLRECDFRRMFGAQVLAIEQRDGTMQCPPVTDAPLRTDQRLWVIRDEDRSPPGGGEDGAKAG